MSADEEAAACRVFATRNTYAFSRVVFRKVALQMLHWMSMAAAFYSSISRPVPRCSQFSGPYNLQLGLGSALCVLRIALALLLGSGSLKRLISDWPIDWSSRTEYQIRTLPMSNVMKGVGLERVENQISGLWWL